MRRLFHESADRYRRRALGADRAQSLSRRDGTITRPPAARRMLVNVMWSDKRLGGDHASERVQRGLGGQIRAAAFGIAGLHAGVGDADDVAEPPRHRGSSASTMRTAPK